jgi:ribosomal protein S13
MKKILTKVEGIGKKKSEELIKELGVDGLVDALEEAPEKLKKDFDWMKKKVLKGLNKQWEAFKSKL